MMREAKEEPGVIIACTTEGREEALKSFFSEIELCEKALNEYLEQKKKWSPQRRPHLKMYYQLLKINFRETIYFFDFDKSIYYISHLF